MSLPRVATVDYLNALPLVRGLSRSPLADRVRLASGTPAWCAEELRSGRADVALIPSIEYLRIPRLKILPGMAIAAKGPAGSVLLFSRVAAPEIRSVSLDRSSRTSVALLRVLLDRRSRHRIEYREREPHLVRMLDGCDAALLIGDAALQADGSGLRVYDLAQEWHAMTGLPFVFAFWALRDDLSLPDLTETFLESKRQGLAERDAIAAETAPRLSLPAERLSRYLRENIQYDLGEEEIRALWLFYRLAREASLVEAVREVTLYGRPHGTGAPLGVGAAP